MFDRKKIKFPNNRAIFESYYHGWANILNGRYYMNGDLLDNEGVWHAFVADATGLIMEIDGAKLNDEYIGMTFANKFCDIKIKNINGKSID